MFTAAEFGKDVAHVITSETGDCGRALFYSAVEKPVNAVTQLINHSIDAHIPQLELVSAPDHTSVGTVLGTAAGAALDFWLLSKGAAPILGTIGGQGAAGATIRSAIVGGVFEGLLQPSASDANFWTDRLTSAAVGAATFAAFSGAGSLLDRTGYFYVPEVRSLAGSVGYGALTGAAGGIVHAQANALFKHGELAGAAETAADTASYAVFGAAFGGLGYAANKLQPPSQTIAESADSKITLYRNSQGQIVQVDATNPDPRNPVKYSTDWQAKRLTTGNFDTQAWNIYRYGSWDAGQTDAPIIASIQSSSDGSIQVKDVDGSILNYPNNGKYKPNYIPELPLGPQDKPVAADMPDFLDFQGPDGIREYSGAFHELVYMKPNTGDGMIGFSYADGPGSPIKFMTLGTKNAESFMFIREGDPFGHQWSVHFPGGPKGLPQHAWLGQIQINDTPGSHGITFVPEGGKPIEMKLGENFDNLRDLLNFTPKAAHAR